MDMEGRGRAWKGVEGGGRAWKGVEGRERGMGVRSVETTRLYVSLNRVREWVPLETRGCPIGQCEETGGVAAQAHPSLSACVTGELL